MKKPAAKKSAAITGNYTGLVGNIGELLDSARRTSARAVNAIMTATYWEIGRHIVEFEQSGKARAEYGERLLEKLSGDLTARFGRGFGLIQIRIMRQFFVTYPGIRQSAIDDSVGTVASIRQSPIDELSEPVPFDIRALANRFPLSWTHYTRLLRVENPTARDFYQTEALRGGWTVCQLERQISSQFYQRTALLIQRARCMRQCTELIVDLPKFGMRTLKKFVRSW